MECEGEASASFNNRFSLPPEILIEILSRLPVKSLLKFKCVSKSWLSLISSDEFIKIHLSLSANKEDAKHMLFSEELDFRDRWIYKEFPLASLFYDSISQALDLDYPIEDDSEYLRVGGSCNGLVLLINEKRDLFLVWNPTTGKHKKLPFLASTQNQRCLAYGLGFDEIHDDYKVVAVFYNYITAIIDDEIKVCSLKSDCWKTVDNNCRDTLIYYSALFVGGTLHWYTDRNIIYFDLADEKWDKMETPSYEAGEKGKGMEAMGGSNLYVFTEYNGTHIGVWVMKEYRVKESWIKLLTIKYQDYHNGFDAPLFRSNKGEILFLVQCTFWICNPKDDSFRYPNLTNHQGNHDVKVYVESLVCPF